MWQSSISPPFLKTIILDLFKLSLNLHLPQQVSTESIFFCKPLLVNDGTTKPSANNNVYLKTIHNLKATFL